MTVASTADYIAHHAALRPDDIAVLDSAGSVTFSTFHQDLERFSSALADLGVKPGDTVAVEWTTLYHHLLFVVALEALGVATFSYAKSSQAANWPFLASTDLIICTGGVPENHAGPVLVLTDDLLAGFFQKESQRPFRPRLLDPGQPVRIHFTSGTTGDAKRIVRTAGVNEFRIWQYQIKEAYTRHSRFLVFRPFSVQAIYGRAVACLRMGGACIGGFDKIVGSISKHGVTHLSALPADLTVILGMLPQVFEKPEALTVATFGARVPDELRMRVLRDLATEVIESYGANEAGSICTMSPDGIGAVVPGVEVEVVDGNDRPSIGRLGRVRVRSAGLIAAYDNDRKATGRMFRDGWFYPGDRGTMPDARSLILHGRDDDLVNIGGFKVDCVEVEDQLRRVISPQDLCVTSVTRADGMEKLCIAVVLDRATSLDEIKGPAAAIFSDSLREVLMVQVQRIPRTETGKARRGVLRALLEKK